MNTTKIYHLASLSIVDLVGADAETILHNLTTNQIKGLVTGQCVETFITDIRGKTLGHVCACRLENGFRMIGAAGQSQAIVDHADKYTIREDAVPTIQDETLRAYVTADIDAATRLKEAAEHYPVQWLGMDSIVWLTTDPDAFESLCSENGFVVDSETAFHQARTIAGFPWHGIDFDGKNLPQEADRPGAISFTKGCYLGQETVARLDALGQVQKQLVRWTLDSVDVAAGSELHSDEKLVGRLTSIARLSDSQSTAIGIARRSHFEPGSVANGTTRSGLSFTATVFESQD